MCRRERPGRGPAAGAWRGRNRSARRRLSTGTWTATLGVAPLCSKTQVASSQVFGLTSRGPDPEQRPWEWLAASSSLQDEAEQTLRASDPIQPWRLHGSQLSTVFTLSVWEKNKRMISHGT